MENEDIKEQDVLIIGDRIDQIKGPESIITTGGMQLIDGKGKYLIPGLTDMHVHVSSENDLKLFIANGVTTVRNMYGFPIHNSYRKRAERNELIGPYVYSTNALTDGNPPYWNGSNVVETHADAEKIVRESIEDGFIAVKIYNMLSLDAFRYLCEEGRKQGVDIVGHIPDDVGLHRALEEGIYSIEHLLRYDYNAVKDSVEIPKWTRETREDHQRLVVDNFDSKKVGDLAAKTVQTGTWNCPTLVVNQARASSSPSRIEKTYAKEGMQYVSASEKAQWNPKTDFRIAHVTEKFFDDLDRSIEHQKFIIKTLYDKGAKLLIGTDTPNPFVVQGFSVHEELQNFVECGLRPYDVLKIATRDAAEYFRMSHEFGTITVGKRADLVLLEKNPIDAIENASHPLGVMYRGNWIDRQGIDDLLESVVEAYKEKPLTFEGFASLKTLGQSQKEVTMEVEHNGKIIMIQRIATYLDGENNSINLQILDERSRELTEIYVKYQANAIQEGYFKQHVGTIELKLVASRPTMNGTNLTGKGLDEKMIDLFVPDGTMLFVNNLFGFKQLVSKITKFPENSSESVTMKEFDFDNPTTLVDTQFILQSETVENGLKKYSGIKKNIKSSHNMRLFLDGDGTLEAVEFDTQMGTLKYRKLN